MKIKTVYTTLCHPEHSEGSPSPAGRFFAALRMTTFFCCVVLLVAGSSHAQSPCRDDLGKIPIQAGGRIKPLSVHAKETLKLLTGKAKPFEDSAVVTYCKLSLAFLDE